MKKYFLKIIPPFEHEAFEVQLFDDSVSAPKIVADQNSIFSDWLYTFDLKCDSDGIIKNGAVYVNGEYKLHYENGSWKPNYENERIFSDCFGYAELKLIVEFNDGIRCSLHSNLLTVLIKSDDFNKNVKAMVKYVYNHCENFMMSGKARSKNFSDLKYSQYKSLDSKIALAEKISVVYEENYAYFRTNCKCKVEKISVIEKFDRVQRITAETFQYIVTHPEHLERTKNPNTVRFKKRFFQPIKTLSLKNSDSRNIYENKVVLCFLQKMLGDISEMKNQCENILSAYDRTHLNIPFVDGYIDSAEFVFWETLESMRSAFHKLTKLKEKYSLLLTKYRNIFTFSTDSAPRPENINPTMIFMSIPQYNKIFICIKNWVAFGIYDFSRENFLLSLDGISSLYEKYILAKMIDYLEYEGYILNERKQILYPLHDNAKYRAVAIENKFVFAGRKKIIIYYQPVIYDGDRYDENNSFDMPSLYRNNSISMNQDYEIGGTYYVPDFVIQSENNQYLIMDAKFKKEMNVRKYDLKNLALKYLISLSVASKNSKIEGLFVIYGKCEINNVMKNVYDKEKSAFPAQPIFKTVPIMEEVNPENHHAFLKEIFGTVFKD